MIRAAWVMQLPQPLLLEEVTDASTAAVAVMMPRAATRSRVRCVISSGQVSEQADARVFNASSRSAYLIRGSLILIFIWPCAICSSPAVRQAAARLRASAAVIEPFDPPQFLAFGLNSLSTRFQRSNLLRQCPSLGH